MAAPGKPSGSKWGSFLSSAVAGVESRLDNMLAEDAAAEANDAAAARKKAQQPQQQAPMTAAAAAKSPPPANSRSSPNTRTNDRLQARLAKAMAGKAAAGSDGKGPASSPRSSFDSRGSMDRPSSDRPSMDAQSTGAKEEEVAKTPERVSSDTPPPASAAAAAAAAAATTGEATPPAEADEPLAEKSTPSPQPESETMDEQQSATRQSDISGLAKDVEDIKVRQNEEIQGYVERIDSLQSKLQYLSKNAAESAKKTAKAAPSGSVERKLAEKDEKIALLMEEGQKLSSSDHTLRTTIRKLRQQMAEVQKQTEEQRKGKEKALAEVEALRSRLDGSEEQEKREEEAQKATAHLQKEIESLKKDNAAKDQAMRKLEQDLRAKSEKAEAASTEAHSKALAAEKDKQRELEDTIATLKAEKESLSDKARLEGLEWSEKLERAAERSRTMEAEMKSELRTMESKLEAMRAMAEEASSGTAGEAQVKLIRQIETLQSQYSTASDNWQGIEASLLAKVANLEKERDEAQRRESEMRRKAREAASRCRNLEEELQDLQPELTTTKQELETCREQLAALRIASKSTETALEQARAEVDKLQRAAARELQSDSDRRPWGAVDDVPMPSPRVQSRPDSPLLSVPRTFSSDLAGLQIHGRSPRRSPISGSMPDGSAEGSRRPSSQHPLGRTNSSAIGLGLPPMPFSPFEPPPSEPAAMNSPSLAGREDLMDDRAPSSPPNVAQDMISVSTVGAGPSVQLVERMSAAIRRLEAEKVAAKEEMTRVCAQRDEARSDIVGLMKDVEAAKSAAERVTNLEKELASVNSRYQTTLEMLGEKSELVEELKADVQDVKAMYRELVERTVK